MPGEFKFEDYEYKKFLEKFIMSRESETRNNIAMISAICEVLADEDNDVSPEEFRGYLNDIMVACCSIMKMTELYTKLTKSLFNSDLMFSSVDMNRFLSEFAEKSNEALGMKCDVRFDRVDGYIFAETNEEFLEYILLGCVRKAVIDGATAVRVLLEKMENSDVCITIMGEEFEPDYKISKAIKDMVTNNLSHINRKLTERLNGVYFCKDDVMCTRIMYERKSLMHLKAPERSYPVQTFTSFHNMLADLSDYKFF